MLRKLGLTPDQLRNAYEQEMKKPFEEQEIVKFFGKPPYEFLGEVTGRDYPVYENFVPQLYDHLGREYQRTDDPEKFFVRIPLRITRSMPANGKYEDYIGFPRVGDKLSLTSLTTEVHVTVLSVPYERGYAVSNMFVEKILEVPFIPDLIDQHGRYFMRCNRDECFLMDSTGGTTRQNSSGTKTAELPDTDLYYVRLPQMFSQPNFAELATSYRQRIEAEAQLSGNGPNGKRKRSKRIVPEELISSIFCDTSEPYIATDSLDGYVVPTLDRKLNKSEVERRKRRVLDLLASHDVRAAPRTGLGDKLVLYNFHLNMFFTGTITGVQPVEPGKYNEVVEASQMVDVCVNAAHRQPPSV